MIKQITLHNHGYGGFSFRCVWLLCTSAIREYFDLPRDCERVIFTAYRRASVNRVKIEMTHNAWGQRSISIEGRPRYDFQSLTKTKIFKLLQKHGTFYVGCEYE